MFFQACLTLSLCWPTDDWMEDDHPAYLMLSLLYLMESCRVRGGSRQGEGEGKRKVEGKGEGKGKGEGEVV
jgi:hypothetical protein